MSKTIVVAGGAGFLGSHLCDSLVTQNSVVCVDNLITGSIKNISHLITNKNFKFINCDISSEEVLKELSNFKIDEIYNLACPASPIDYMEYPIETLLACSAGAKNLLDLSVSNKAKILQTSTSEVYGDPLVHPQVEEYWGNVNPVGVRSCYDEGKRFMEALTTSYNKKYDLQTRIVRIFNTYGPRMKLNDGRVVPNFIYQALQNIDITVYGDGNQTRSFCYVSDMVDGLIRLMNSDVNTPVNIGNPNEQTMNQFAQSIIGLTGSKSKIKHLPALQDDPQQRKPNIEKANRLLCWSPVVSFEDGMKTTISFFKDVINEIS